MTNHPVTYQIGDPSPMSNIYQELNAPCWDACLDRDPDPFAPPGRVCQWPRIYPHTQHIAVAGYRVTAVWP